MPEWIVNYWIQWVFGLVITALTAYCRHLSNVVKKERVEQQALRDGVRALLRRQIIEDCEEATASGFCPSDKKATIENMYEAYHSLGGNGTVSAAVKNVINTLPTQQAK